MKTLVPFAFGGVQISKDAEGRINLTDLWKAAGSVDAQRPNDWLSLPTTKGFLAATQRFLIAEKSGIIKSKAGRYGGTFAHQQVALEYAQYLSPDLAVAVNQVFFERVAEEKNPDLITERAVKTYKKQGKSDVWISKRMKGISTRIVLTSTLVKHGVDDDGFRNCTNAIYTPLFGGGASYVRAKKNLPAKANTREHMTSEELTAVELAEQLATGRIVNHNVRGNVDCEGECLRAARILANAIKEVMRG